MSEFAQQTALQCHNMLVSGYAVEECLFEINNRKQYGGGGDQMETTSPPEDLFISLKGQYDFVVTED